LHEGGGARATAADLLGAVTQGGTHFGFSGAPLDLTMVDVGKLATPERVPIRKIGER